MSVPTDMATLLRACAQESGLKLGMAGPAHTALRRAIADDPAVAAEARRRLSDIPEAVLMRDHASRWLKATLTKALEA